MILLKFIRNLMLVVGFFAAVITIFTNNIPFGIFIFIISFIIAGVIFMIEKKQDKKPKVILGSDMKNETILSTGGGIGEKVSVEVEGETNSDIIGVVGNNTKVIQNGAGTGLEVKVTVGSKKDNNK